MLTCLCNFEIASSIIIDVLCVFYYQCLDINLWGSILTHTHTKETALFTLFDCYASHFCWYRFITTYNYWFSVNTFLIYSFISHIYIHIFVCYKPWLHLKQWLCLLPKCFTHIEMIVNTKLYIISCIFFWTWFSIQDYTVTS